MDITALGELLIDYTPAGASERGMPLLEQNPGGAPANVLVTASRLGMKTALVARVGQDGQGAFLRRALERENVDLRGLSEDPEVFTTLAFVELLEGGERRFSFARKPGADTRLSPGHIPAGLIEESRVLHLGTLSMTAEPARSATREAVSRAKAAGRLVSLDVNWRPLLWPDEREAVGYMTELLDRADLVKLSEEEALLLTGEREPERAAEAVLRRGPRLCAVTLGAEGALLAAGEKRVRVPAEPGPVVDTTGAGDAFWGGLLTRFLQKDLDASPKPLDEAALADLARFAAHEAAKCVAHRGAF